MLTLMFIVITIAILFVMSRDNRSNSNNNQREGIMHSITRSTIRWTMWLIVVAAWISYNVSTLPYLMDNGNQLSSLRLLAEMIQMVIGVGVLIVGYINLMLHLIVWHDERQHRPIVPLGTKMYRWVKGILPLILVLVVGCGDGDHAFRSTLLMEDGYPTYCQRDTNQDGWHTLEEGAKVLYKDLGPCPTCQGIGVVPVYTSRSDTSWSSKDQFVKQEMESIDSIPFPFYVCDMSEAEWDQYRLMKWDYALTIWWRGNLLGLEKLDHKGLKWECDSRMAK